MWEMPANTRLLSWLLASSKAIQEVIACTEVHYVTQGMTFTYIGQLFGAKENSFVNSSAY
jgi:ribonuclease HI